MFDLGGIDTNNQTSDPSTDSNKIKLNFSVVVTDLNPLINGSNYSIIAAVELDIDEFIMITDFTFSADTTAASPEAIASIQSQPTTMERGETSVAVVSVYLTHPAVQFMAIVANSYGYDDRFHFGKINGITGSSYSCNSEQSWINDFGLSFDRQSYSKTKTIFPYLLNTDTSRQISDVGNKIELVVPITALDKDSAVGLQTIIFGVQLDDTEVWSAVTNITILDTVKTIADTAPSAVTATRLSQATILPGSSAIFQLKITVPAQKSTIINLEDESNDADIIPVSARIVDPGACGQLLPENNFSFSSSNGIIGTCSNAYTQDTYVLINVAYKSFNIGSKSPTIKVSGITASGAMQYTVDAALPREHLTAVASSLGFDAGSLHPKTEIGLRVSVDIPASAKGDSFIFKILPDSDVNDFDLKICRAQIHSVGYGLPCIYDHTLSTNYIYEKSYSSRLFYDQVIIDISGICPSSVPGDQNSFDLDIIYQLPFPQEGIIDGISVSPGAGFNVDNSTLFASVAGMTSNSLNLTDVESGLVGFNNNKTEPYFGMTVPNPHEADMGDIHYARYIFKPQPKTRGNYMFFLEADAGITICKVKVLKIGQNMPCAAKPEGYLDKYSQVTLSNSENEAYVRFEGLTNWGDSILSLDNYADEDAIEIATFVKTSDITPSSTLVSASVLTGANYDKNNTLIHNILTSVNLKTTTSGTFLPSFIVNGPIYNGVSKIVTLRLTVPPSYNDLTKVTISNSDFNTGKFFYFCGATITTTGLNVPCVNPRTPFNFSDVYEQATDNNPQYYESISITADIMYFPYLNSNEESVLDIEVSLFVPNGVSGPINLEASIGSETTSVSISVEAIPDGYGNATVTDLRVLVNDTAIVSEVSWKKWIPFNITIPRFLTIPLQIAVLTPSVDKRPILTAEGVRFVTQGENICCANSKVNLEHMFPITRNATENITTFMQTDFLFVDLGYVTNGGFTFRRGMEKPEDNILSIEVLVQVTDHPLTIDGSVFNVSIAVQSNDIISAGSRKMQIHRDISDTNRENVDRAFIVVDTVLVDANTTVFRSGDILTLTSVIYHKNYSRAEGVGPVSVQVLMPSWVGYVYNNSLSLPGLTPNSYETNYTGGHHLEQPLGENNTAINFVFEDGLFFASYVSLNFTLTMDPWDRLRYGNEIMKSAIVSQVHCLPTKFGSFPATGITKTICGPYTQASFSNFPKENCLAAAPLDDCAVTGSSARDDTYHPKNVINNDNSVWSPALRAGLGWKEFIQFDFRAPMRISGVTFTFPSSGYMKVTKVLISISNTGKVWIPIVSAVIPDNRTVSLPKPVHTKFSKITIVDVDGDWDGSMPIGIEQIVWLGCFVDKSPIKEDCLPDTTRLTTDPTKYRHMSYDSINKRLYFCDISPWRGMTMLCFSHTEGTLSFSELPQYISHIQGFSPSIGKVYFKDETGPDLACRDGFRVEILPNGEAPPTDIVVAKPVPAISKTMVAVTDGPYSADFEGIKYNGNLISVWGKCCVV